MKAIRRAVRAEGPALQRAVGDQAIFGVLELLRVLDVEKLRPAIIGLAHGTGLQLRRAEPVAAIRAVVDAKARRFDSILAPVLATQLHMDAIAEKVVTPGRLDGEVLIVVVGGLAVLDVRLETFEFGVGDEVDDAADGVRTIGSGGAARDHVDSLHEELRKLADVRDARDVRADDALTVEQGQRADGAEAAQAERAQTLQAAAGGERERAAAGAALERRQFDDGVEDVRVGALFDVDVAQHRGRRGLHESFGGEARAGHDDLGQLGRIGSGVRRGLRDGRGGDGQRRQCGGGQKDASSKSRHGSPLLFD